MGKLALVVLAIVVIVVILSGQGSQGGSCDSVQSVIGHSTECAYRFVKGNGVTELNNITTLILVALAVLSLATLKAIKAPSVVKVEPPKLARDHQGKGYNRVK